MLDLWIEFIPSNFQTSFLLVHPCAMCINALTDTSRFFPFLSQILISCFPLMKVKLHNSRFHSNSQPCGSWIAIPVLSFPSNIYRNHNFWQSSPRALMLTHTIGFELFRMVGLLDQFLSFFFVLVMSCCCISMFNSSTEEMAWVL